LEGSCKTGVWTIIVVFSPAGTACSSHGTSLSNEGFPTHSTHHISTVTLPPPGGATHPSSLLPSFLQVAIDNSNSNSSLDATPILPHRSFLPSFVSAACIYLFPRRPPLVFLHRRTVARRGAAHNPPPLHSGGERWRSGCRHILCTRILCTCRGCTSVTGDAGWRQTGQDGAAQDGPTLDGGAGLRFICTPDRRFSLVGRLRECASGSRRGAGDGGVWNVRGWVEKVVGRWVCVGAW
jgi:hypothetical protein